MEEIQKPKKNYTSRLQGEMESHSAFTTSTTFSTTNDRCLIRELLEFHRLSNYRQGLGI